MEDTPQPQQTLVQRHVFNNMRQHVSSLYHRILLLEPFLRPLLCAWYTSPPDGEARRTNVSGGAEGIHPTRFEDGSQSRSEAPGRGRMRGVPRGTTRHCRGRGGHSNGPPQERQISMVDVERQWTHFLRGLVLTFRFYGIMICLAHSVSSHFTKKGGETWAIYFAHIAWLQAIIAYIPWFCMGLALEWMRRKPISSIRKSWSKWSSTNEGSALFNTSRLLEIPAAATAWAVILTVLAAISVTASSPTLTISPAPEDGISFPLWARTLFWTIAVVQILAHTIMSLAFAQLGVPFQDEHTHRMA